MAENKKLPIFSKEECSQDFINSFCHSSRTLSIECTACGRIHFDDGGDYEKGDLEILKQLMGLHPDQYTMYPYDTSIQHFDFGGKQIVFDCRCNYAKMIEDLLLANQSNIINFFEVVLTEKHEAVKEEKKQSLKGLNTLKMIQKRLS